MGIILSDSDLASTSSNDARWFGEQVYLTYDWCYSHLTASERQTLMSRWNNYNNVLRQKAWGGVDMMANNYHWGYLRNEMAWGITSYGENTMAESHLEDALVTRWRNAFVPYAAGAGLGGVATEGSQYGPYLLGYSVVPFQSAEMHGRQIYSESNFHRSAVFGLIYGTTPGPSIHRGSTVEGYEVMPIGDDSFWRDGRSAHHVDFGTFMTNAAMRWSGVAVGRYARQWLNTVQPGRQRFVRAVDPGGSAQAYNTLPLDYYAAGPGTLFTRNNWSSGATSVHLMMGDDVPGTGHGHDDFGFQIWRGGRWLSRETTAYAEAVTGYAGGTAVSNTHVVAHNGIAIHGAGSRAGSYRTGPPRVLRVQSAPSFSFAATDLTENYRATGRPQVDNPAVANVVREFLFLRNLETLVVFDRLATNDAGGTPAANIPKAFLAHFENAPQVTSGNSVLGVNGSQALRVITLAPANPTYRVINEASNGGTAEIAQYRLEVETSGSVESYFVHVLQARDAAGADVVANMTQDAATFRISLSHPNGGTANIVFNKGMASTGGSVTINGTMTPLANRIQGMQVTDNGPVWEGTDGGDSGGAGPAAPTGLRILQ